jgi:hypothetical protein
MGGMMLLSFDNWNNFKNLASRELIPRLCISYAPEDQAFVQRLGQDLHAHKLRMCSESWEMRGNDSISQKINAVIATKDYLIVVLSPGSIKSRWVQKELGAGLADQLDGQGIQVLMALLGDCALPASLSQRLYADFRTDYTSGLKQLVQASGLANSITDSDVSRAPVPELVDLVELRKFLVKHFNKSELRDLCQDLNIDYENLGGQGKAGKARELVAYCSRHGWITNLYNAAHQRRPSVSWH